jgi:hypothetical protein
MGRKASYFKMKMRFAYFLAVLALLLVSSVAGRADQFSQIQNSPYTYWVPAPTPPPPGYVAGPPQPYYYGPGPYYYGPPPPRVHFFIGFHFH